MTARRVILSILSLPLVVVGMAVGTYFLRIGGGPRPPEVAPEVVVVPNTSLLMRGPAGWLEDVAEPGAARTPHTSMRTLEAFVAERVATAVNEVAGGGGGGDDARRVDVTGGERAAPQVAAVRQRLRPGVNGSDLLDAAGGPECAEPDDRDAADRTTVELSWRELRDAPVRWWPTPVRRGTLVANVVGPRGSARVVAELDEKPWLETEPASVGRRGYVVVSTEPMATEEAAQAVVRQRANDVLAESLEAQVRAIAGAGQVSDDAVRRIVNADAGHLLDKAVVRVDRPYGPVWYGAGLVDVSVDALAPLARDAVQFHAVRQRTVAATVVALPGMLLVLGAVYLGLNAVTRGYFRTHLRVAALAGVALGVVALLVLLFA